MRGLFIFVVYFVLVAASPASSSSEAVVPITAIGDAIIVPQGSPLHFRALGPEAAAEFDGAIDISGTWYYGFNHSDDGEPGYFFYFVPDNASRARLPHFKLRGQPNDIYLTNADALLNKVVTNSDRAAVAKKGAKYLSGHVDIWVDKFEAIVECDAPNFDAHFLRIAQPPKRLAAANVPDGGC